MRQKKHLTPMQAKFVQEYLVDLCGSAAARRAGYSHKKVGVRAAMLMSQEHVREAIAEAMDERAKVTGITAERVLNEIALVAFSDMQNYLDRGKGGTKLKAFEDMPPGTSRAIESMAETRGPQGDRVAVKVVDKMKALGRLCDHLGICKEQVDLSGKVKVDTELTITVVKV